MSLSAKAAAEQAVVYLTQFIPQSRAFLVEEVERVTSINSWRITLSYSTTLLDEGPWLSNGTSRAYKVFEIDMDTGEVNSMKIRDMS